MNDAEWDAFTRRMLWFFGLAFALICLLAVLFSPSLILWAAIPAFAFANTHAQWESDKRARSVRSIPFEIHRRSVVAPSGEVLWLDAGSKDAADAMVKTWNERTYGKQE
jgi:hypothetical protein